jgi:hypothetical protein
MVRMNKFTLLRARITGFKYSYQVQNWINPNRRARNKARNNRIPLRYYAATTPLRLAS